MQYNISQCKLAKMLCDLKFLKNNRQGKTIIKYKLIFRKLLFNKSKYILLLK